EGLEQARRLRPDLIVLDLLLPGLNGREVLARLKDDPATADIPVIVASVLEDDEAPAGVKVLDWFVKPTDREHFIARLRAVCPELFDRERPPTALVVDANPSTRSALGKILQEEGFA